ncbi:MAG: PDZ domain-containing protein [Demequinaceae bacterium]|nr:PDZ domain-containing protein [Demequinaceae bacterium]
MATAAFAISDDGTVTDPFRVPDQPIAPPSGVEPLPPGPRSIVLSLSAMVTAMLVAILTLLPLPYVIDKPGPTFDMFSDTSGTTLLHIDGVETYPPSGELRLTTVAVQGGPDARPSFGAVLRAWLSPTATILPELSYSSEDGSIQQQWVTSQEMAMVAALTHQKIDVPVVVTIVGIEADSNALGFFEEGDVIVSVNGIEVEVYEDLDGAFDDLTPGDPVTVVVSRIGGEETATFDTVDNGNGRAVMGIWVDPEFFFPFDMSIGIDNVGGPSGGAMFALGIIDLLTPENELQGEKVAGTGTIDLRGDIGPIGGIWLKMEGAAQAGSEWFLAPASNCPSVRGNIPDGLTVVAVSTLDEAYDALVAIGEGNASSLPSCA